MTAISRLVVVLGADAAQFVDELEKSDRRAKGFARDTVDNLKKVAAAALALGGAAATGMVAMAVQAAKAAGEVADTADKLGIATERLAGFQLAAKLAGISNEQLGKSLGDSARRLAEFNATGAGPAGDWLKRLGLDTQELARLAPDELFLKYADAIGGLNTRGEQLAAVSALMGDRTGEMIRLIQGGSGAIDEAIQKVKEYGLGLTRVEHEQIEMATDALILAKVAVAGLHTQIDLAAAPFVHFMVNGFNESARASGGFREEIQNAMRIAAQAMGIASNAGIYLNTIMGEVALQGLKVHQAGLEISKFGKELGSKAPGFLGENAREELARVVADMVETEAKIAELEGQISERLLGIVSPEKVAAMFDSIIVAYEKKAEAAVAALKLGGGGEDEIGIGGMSDKDQAAIDALTERLTAESDLKLAAYERDREQINRMIEDEVQKYELLRELDLEYFEWQREQAIAQEEIQLEKDELQLERWEAELEARRNFAREYLQVEQQAANAVVALRMDVVNSSLGLLRSYAGESKAFAIAAIALEKALSIKSILMNAKMTAAKLQAQGLLGAQLAFNSQLIPGNPYSIIPATAAFASTLAAAQAAAAAALGTGALAAGLEAVGGALQIGSLGGGGASIGTPANPVFTQPSGGEQTFTPIGGPVEPVVIVITGNGSGFNPNEPESVLTYVRDQVENSDEIVFSENSRQMALVRKALGRG